MKLFIIGNTLYVREIGSEPQHNDVQVELQGIADGTKITVVRDLDSTYQVAEFKSGKAQIKRDFLADSAFRIMLKKPDGAFLSCEFGCKDGLLYRTWRGNEPEINELWRALIYLIESRKEQDDKVDRLITGYTSE